MLKSIKKYSLTSLPVWQILKKIPITWFIYVLFFAYGLIGIFDRFPWKADEPYSFGIIWNIIINNQWLIPHVAGDPFVEKSPLIFWIGAIFAKALPFIPAHESSRLTIILFMAITIAAFCFIASRLFDEIDRQPLSLAPSHTLISYRVHSITLLVAIIGLTEHIHKLTADIAQLAGATLALAALVGNKPLSKPGSCVARCAQSSCTVGNEGCCAPSALTSHNELRFRKKSNVSKEVKTRQVISGFLFGSGVGIAFLSKGLLVPGIAGLTLFVVAQT